MVQVNLKAAMFLSQAVAKLQIAANNGGKQMRDVWTMTTPKPSEKVHGRHPTQKPRALLERIVDACTEEDALVLDPFCGSGTTGVAAKSKGRRFVGIDMDTQYLELTKRRIEAE